MPPTILGPRCNRQVSCSPDPHNDRSESALAFNPTDPYNMVCSSKKFTDPTDIAIVEVRTDRLVLARPIALAPQIVEAVSRAPRRALTTVSAATIVK